MPQNTTTPSRDPPEKQGQEISRTVPHHIISLLPQTLIPHLRNGDIITKSSTNNNDNEPKRKKKEKSVVVVEIKRIAGIYTRDK